jgi:DNA polymerase-1
MDRGVRQQTLPGLEPECDRPEQPGADSAAATPCAGPSGTGAAPVPSVERLEIGATESLAGRTVYVVDANSLIHQVFHALPEMTSPRGEPVQAVFGFTRDMFSILESRRPDYLLCAFDMPGKTFRHALYEAYKGGRPELDINLAPQFALVRGVLTAMGIPSLGVSGFEADDVLATMARIVEELGAECYLVSGDKDCRQLITDRVRIYNIRKDQVYDREALRADWGIAVEQVVDYQSLVGDATDNVPGVPLVGPKLAQQLLEQYGTLEEVLRHADDVAGAKRKENLRNFGSQALLSRQLVRLCRDVPLELDWARARTGRFDRARLRSILADLGFRGLAAKAGEFPTVAAGETPPQAEPRPAGGGFTYHLVDTPPAFALFLEELRRQKSFSLDTETTSLLAREAKIVGYSFSWNPAEGWYLPVRAPEDQGHLDPQQTLEALRPILEDAAVEKIGQNLKYDMTVLRAAGVALAGVGFDTMLASYLLDAGQRNHNLDELAKRYLDHDTIKISALIGSGKNQKRMDEVPVRLVADYAGEDALLPVQLRPLLEPKLAAANLEELLHKVELPLLEVLSELEYNGIRVDCARLAELGARYGRRMEELEQEIYQMAGHRFNLASPKQLQVVLFDELHLPVSKRTKTGPSTDAEVLEELAPLDPLPRRILEFRQYAKLKSTYCDALPELVCELTGRVHASFNQDVAATGRLSSSNPNLQNIPVRTEEGREIRSAFVPGEPGWVLMAADYSQIELRVLAHYCQDQQLREAFARDEDIHARVASQVYGVPLGEVTEGMRRHAKTVNFGVLYGQSPFGLAKQLAISQEEASKFIDAYFGGYPGIEKFLTRVLADCRTAGYVSTILGRRRAIEGVREQVGRQRNLAERTAINTVIQGSAADLIKLAMIAIHRRLKHEKLAARMLLQIHDELIFEVPSDQLNDLAELVQQEMVGVRALEVPLKVDVKAGMNWADAKPWK